MCNEVELIISAFKVVQTLMIPLSVQRMFLCSRDFTIRHKQVYLLCSRSLKITFFWLINCYNNMQFCGENWLQRHHWCTKMCVIAFIVFLGLRGIPFVHSAGALQCLHGLWVWAELCVVCVCVCIPSLCAARYWWSQVFTFSVIFCGYLHTASLCQSLRLPGWVIRSCLLHHACFNTSE